MSNPYARRATLKELDKVISRARAARKQIALHRSLLRKIEKSKWDPALNAYIQRLPERERATMDTVRRAILHGLAEHLNELERMAYCIASDAHAMHEETEERIAATYLYKQMKGGAA